MLTYYMDVEPHSRWVRSTPTHAAMSMPFYCSEAGVFYARERFATQRSGKESYLLFYTAAGAGVLEQDGLQWQLTPGSAVLLNCRTPHRYATAPGETQWHYHWAHIDGAGVVALEALLNTPQMACVQLSPLAAKESFKYLLSHAKQPDMRTLSQLSLCIHTLLHAMVDARLGAADAAQATHRDYVLAVADEIRTHYREPLCLERLLKTVPLSKYYFIKLFHQYMGTTPYQYLLCYRLTQAKELLGTTQHTISEVALYVGFASESNFTAQFSKRAGQTPSQYRKQMRM